MKKTYSLDQLDCAACAAKMEEAASQVPGVEELRINFLTKTMSLTASEDHFEQVAQNVMAACQRVEPECRVCEVKQDTAAHHDHGHAHGHDHEEGEEHHSLALIGVGAVLFVTGLLLPEGLWRWAALIAAYVVAGGEVLLRAAKNILRGQVFDENFLMAVASLGAMLMGETTEAVAVMLFYQIGEWFQDRAVDKSRASIAQLMDIRPDHANHVLADGSVEVVPPQSLKAGDILLVKPGERIPLDGIILEGTSTLNTHRPCRENPFPGMLPRGIPCSAVA